MTALEQIAHDLLAVPPAAFVAARSARAETMEGDAARAVRAFRKPSVAAWGIDALVRERPDEIADALRLAHELREAQAESDAAALTALNRERRRTVGELLRLAAALASDAGVSWGPAAAADAEKTLNAAMRDARAAAAVRSGRLVRAIEASGLDPVDLDGAILGGWDDTGDVSDGGAAASDGPVRDDLAERRARRAAERAQKEREKARVAADRALAEADAAHEDARRRAKAAAEQVEALQAQLTRARKDARAADHAQEAAERRRREAAAARASDADA